MRCLLNVVVFSLLNVFNTAAQDGARIKEELQTINKTTLHPCVGNNGRLISNRAMNIFLADKTSYASENGDLSYYTNYVTLQSNTGLISINHNFQKAKGNDEPLKTLLSVGFKANIADGFNTSFLDKRFKNVLALTINHTWLGKVRTKFSGCEPNNSKSANGNNQKLSMDALRAGILNSLLIDIKNREDDFQKSLLLLDSSTQLPGQSPALAKQIITQNFYEDLAEEYREKYAKLQAEALTKTNNFKRISTHWTSIIAYVPLAFPKYYVAGTLSASLSQKHPYPIGLSLIHTHFWENSKTGRLFFTISVNLSADNGVTANQLLKTNFTDYKNLGGSDTVQFASIKNQEAYIGSYKQFLTPSFKARLVYFSHNSHVGLSFLMEQYLGTNNLLNSRFGIPIILINSKKIPALNIEMQVNFFDMTHQINSDRKMGNKSSIGVGIGFPMSRLMY
jgi:hypothetical protein